MKRLVTLLIFAVGLGATLILTPYAFGQESKSPVQAIWDAIYDLQNQDQRLQVQIDDLRAESGQIRQEDGLLSEISARVQVERGSELGHVTINVIVKNDGPEQAAGVKLTLFYKMSLFQLDSMPPDYCKYLERGIIQCDLGTMGSGDEVSILVTATELEMGVPTTITADVSSTTEDRVPSNNHAVLDIITGRGDLAEEGSRNEEQAATGVSDPQESNGSNNENAENGAGNQTGSRGGDAEMPAETSEPAFN